MPPEATEPEEESPAPRAGRAGIGGRKPSCPGTGAHKGGKATECKECLREAKQRSRAKRKVEESGSFCLDSSEKAKRAKKASASASTPTRDNFTPYVKELYRVHRLELTEDDLTTIKADFREKGKVMPKPATEDEISTLYAVINLKKSRARHYIPEIVLGNDSDQKNWHSEMVRSVDDEALASEDRGKVRSGGTPGRGASRRIELTVSLIE